MDMSANTIEQVFGTLPIGACFTRNLTGATHTSLVKVDATTARTPWGMLVGIHWSDEPVLVQRTSLGRFLARIAHGWASARHLIQNA